MRRKDLVSLFTARPRRRSLLDYTPEVYDDSFDSVASLLEALEELEEEELAYHASLNAEEKEEA